MLFPLPRQTSSPSPSPSVDVDLPAGHLAPVVDLAAERRARREPLPDLPPTSELVITRELLVALGGRWAPRD